MHSLIFPLGMGVLRGFREFASKQCFSLTPPPLFLPTKSVNSLVVGQLVLPAGPGSIPGDGGTFEGGGGALVLREFAELPESPYLWKKIPNEEIKLHRLNIIYFLK